MQSADPVSGSPLERSYDDAPYHVHVWMPSHPDQLASVARLHGLRTAPVEQSRVLEIGCASGANIIPMAEGLPQSQFVGIDFSARQIEAGQAIVASLGLTNIRLEQQNLTTIGPSFGAFDYIIAHGVYSWVPPDVADSLLQQCAQLLTPNGVAFIS